MTGMNVLPYTVTQRTGLMEALSNTDDAHSLSGPLHPSQLEGESSMEKRM